MPVIIEDAVKIPNHYHGEIVELLGRVMASDEADYCTFQIYDEENEILHLIAQVGFDDEFIQYFKEVIPFDGSACGRAIGSGIPIVICDIHEDEAFIPHMEIVKASNFRAVKCLPIITTSNRKVGVISTHYRDPKWTWNLNSLNGITEELAVILEKISHELHISAIAK
jgi:hypothetical protein